MTKPFLSLPMKLGTALAVLALVVSGCGSSGSGSSSSKTITFGTIAGWTDETGTTALLQDVLEDNGYSVKVQSVSDNAPMYEGLASGKIDVLSSSWLEKTHKTYWEKYGTNLEDLGMYYKNATSFLAVPTYSDVKSIADLPSHASEFGGQIVGIEPGAGLTELTQKSVIPAYGLDKNFKLLTSSTAAMLTELKKATAAKKPIVVTMWKPFWANSGFPIRALADPKGAYGAPENLHVIARDGFSKDFPKVAAMLSHFQMNDTQYDSLENLVANKYPVGKETDAARAWLKANPTFEPQLASYLK